MHERETLSRALDALEAVARTGTRRADFVRDRLDVPGDLDAGAWQEDFWNWIALACAYAGGWSSAIGHLCDDFGEWAIAHDGVPCSRATFERLLTEAGLVCIGTIVRDLLPLADLELALMYLDPVRIRPFRGEDGDAARPAQMPHSDFRNSNDMKGSRAE